jgi:NCAIR mutase (PurE)-related protein
VNAQQLGTLLAEVAAGRLDPDAALDRLRQLPFEDLSFARIDHHRALRQGHPEVVFCEGKTPEQVVAICERLAAMSGGFLGTRCGEAHAAAVRRAFPDAVWSPLARTVHLIPDGTPEAPPDAGTILVVSAGTSDLPVAEEAAVVA